MMAVVMTPVAMVTDAPQAVRGPDHPAIRISVIRRRIVEAVMEMVPELVVPERKAVMAESAAMKRRAAKTAAAMVVTPTAMVTAAAMATTAMPATDFGYESFGSVFRRWHGGRVDQRQRLGALAGCGGQRQ
jgi:hypothetical protein